jgi:uncharacterized repeat protein (TIGR03803 family)
METLSLWKTGLALILLGAATAVATQAQTFTRLITFNGTNGSGPSTPLVQGQDGNLYGTTWQGGANSQGTIFKVTPSGNEFNLLYSFCAQPNCADGSAPLGSLLQLANGNFYGTTFTGGANNFGALFDIPSIGGTLTVQQSFDETAGEDPRGGLAMDSSGNFYGLTTAGGSNYNVGSIFKVTDGTLQPLVLLNETDGYEENAQVTLVLGNDGNFYGTTSSSGAPDYSGTIFNVTPSGTFTLLHAFNGTSDGAGPEAGLVLGTDGNFYGTTPYEGANRDGVVFQFNPTTGTYTTIYSFNGTYGSAPYAALTLGSDGNFYGTTSAGGANGQGTIFRITPAGAITDLYDFTASDGQGSIAGVIQHTNGTFYGSTFDGGSNSDGMVFSLNTGLGPFVVLTLDSGIVNNVIGILGQGFTGTLGVSFNGAPARFDVVSDTYLTASVPVTATTGPVTVDTPSGTLTSNRTFRILATAIARP